MTASARTGAVAILAGNGALPGLLAAALLSAGRTPVVFAIAGEADPAGLPAGAPVHVIRWGEIGRLFKLIQASGCREAIFVGGIARRPDFTSLRPDLGAMKLIPRIVQIMRNGDDRLLGEVAGIFAERGVELVGPLDVAPDLALGIGAAGGLRPSPEAMREITVARSAALAIGRLDIGQAAVALGARVVAVEAAEGTDMMLARVAELRRGGRLADSGGVLVKCLKPQQDRRLDLPTIGPDTAERAAAAGLSGVAADAGATLLAGRAETVAAFDRLGLFLWGLAAETAHG